MSEQAIPLIYYALAHGDAVHEGRGVWRPVVMCGTVVMFEAKNTRTNRRDALAEAKDLTARVKQAAIEEARPRAKAGG